jgi:hypothetical protein
MKQFVLPIIILIVSGNGDIEIKEEVLEINYDITSGSIDNLTSDINTTSMLIDITAPEDGIIKAIIPRKIIDSTYEDQDDIFYILIDGEEVMFTEEISDEYRILEIPYVKDSKQIEIIGTTTIDDLQTVEDGLLLGMMLKI